MRRHPIATALGTLAALGALASTAAALPGDPPITLLSPGAGAVLPASPGGVAVTYACPVFRQIDAGGGFVLYGKWSDYNVSLATGPELGADGRLRQDLVVAQDTGHQPNTLPADQCAGTLGTGRGDGPENTPGTYYWQAWRLAGGAYDTSEVRSFTIRANAAMTVRAPGPAFGGYAVPIPLGLTGVPDGAVVTLQRKAGSRWVALGSTRALGGAGEVVATLPAGRQVLRVAATLGTQAVTSPPRALTVRPAGAKRVTSAADDGAWKGARLGVRFRIAGGGRTIRAFTATVTMICPQVALPGGQGQVTTRAGIAAFPSARIAPDGRFVVAAVRKGSSVLVRGRVRGGRLTGGVAALSVSTCTGQGTFTAARA